MEAVAILGAGGHGRDLGAIAEELGLLWYFYDDGPRMFPIRPTADLPDGHPYVVGVNDPQTRKALAVGSTPTRLIHPTATIAPNADISPGCVVGAGCHIGPSTALGPHTHVGPGTTLTRTTVGAFTTISPGVDIAGDVTIGDECLVGVGAVVSNLVTIGDRCVIGAGAVVVDDVPSDTTVAGVPAKPLQRREQ